MALWSIGGESGGVFTWSAVYDDGAHTLTLLATGPGRCTIVVEASNGQRAACFFTQADGITLPLPTGITVQQSITVVSGSEPFVITNIRLKPLADPQGFPGGFELLTESWHR
jgi:hypothetical protein